MYIWMLARSLRITSKRKNQPALKGRGRNNFLKSALRFRLDLFDLKAQNRRNSPTYFEDFVLEDRSKPVLDPDRGMA